MGSAAKSQVSLFSSAELVCVMFFQFESYSLCWISGIVALSSVFVSVDQ